MLTTLRSRFVAFVLLGTTVFSGQVAFGQLISAPYNWGFERGSSIAATVDEMLGPHKPRELDEPILGPGYPELRMAEVQWKSLRHRLMEVVDPKTREKKMEFVWYLVYRVIQRDYTELAGDSRDELLKKLDDPEINPQNAVDGIEGYSLQLPRFILRTDDSEEQKEYVDEVNLEVQRAVFAREFQNRAADLKLLSSVEGITEVQDPVSVHDPDPLSKAVYGVAIWRGVDPKTDYFTITMTGFSNAYRITTNAAGEPVFEEKVIVQRFGRPGDEFEQTEAEFRLINSAKLDLNGDVIVDMDGTISRFEADRQSPRFVHELRAEFEKDVAAGVRPEQKWPIWQYQVRQARVTVPKFQTILRNARVQPPDVADGAAGNGPAN